MNRNRKIAFLSLGIAMYAVLSAFIVIPIVNRIKLDLGYIVFGIYLNTFGIPATIVGVLGCIIGNMLKGGSIPIAWAIGQAFIGIALGYLLPRTEKIWLKLVWCVLATFIGMSLIKTVIEVAMYHYPVYLKFLSNTAAFVADVIPLIMGVLLNRKIRIVR